MNRPLGGTEDWSTQAQVERQEMNYYWRPADWVGGAKCQSGRGKGDRPPTTTTLMTMMMDVPASQAGRSKFQCHLRRQAGQLETCSLASRRACT